MKSEQIARIVHEANKAYCEELGDNSQESWENTSQEIQESAIEGAVYRTANPETGNEDMHANWCKTKIANGWKYGEEKSVFRKTHPCLVDYADLPEEQKLKDALFSAIVDVLKDAD